MKSIVIKQTIVYTSGLFTGKQTHVYITVYKHAKPVPVLGNGYRLIKEERIK